MKKIILAIAVVILLIFSTLYFLLFTQPGNNIIKPAVESRINESLGTNMKLVQFTLRPSFINILLSTPYGSTISLKGNFNILLKGINANYRLNVTANEKALIFKGYRIKGPFWVTGHIKGLLKKVIVTKGKSNFADAKINYTITLLKGKPYSVLANISHLKLSRVFEIMNMDKLANGQLEANIKLTSFKKNALKGIALIYLFNGKLDAKNIKKRFGIEIPPALFTSKAKVTLNSSIVSFKTDLNSGVANATVDGVFNQKNNTINASYEIKLKNLALLSPVVHMPLKGSLNTKGTIKGSPENLIIKGYTNIANSDTKYRILISKKEAKTVIFSAKQLQLSRLLYMLDKPIYAKGSASATGTIKLKKHEKISGNIMLNIQKGMIIGKTIKRLYKINTPDTPFSFSSKARIKESKAFADLLLNSPIARFSSNDLQFDIKRAKLNMHYLLTLPDLGKLSFITGRKLKGSIKANGLIKFNKTLTLTAHSNTLGGKVDIDLTNNVIRGKANSIRVVKLTEMLGYKRIFDSKGDVNFNYNLLTKKGSVDALFVNGHILPNRLTLILSTMARFDITREIYKTTKIHSLINDKIIMSDLDMVSRFTHIISKKALIDLNRNWIKAKLEIYIKKKPVYVKLEGNLSHPKIKVNLKGLIKHKIEKKLKEEIKKKLLKKNLLKKLGL